MVGHLPLLFSSLEENHHRQPRSQLHRFYVKPHIRINISENCETNHTRISPIRCCMRLHMPPKDSALWHTSHGLTRAANKSMHGHAIKRVLHMLDTEVCCDAWKTMGRAMGSLVLCSIQFVTQLDHLEVLQF